MQNDDSQWVARCIAILERMLTNSLFVDPEIQNPDLDECEVQYVWDDISVNGRRQRPDWVKAKQVEVNLIQKLDRELISKKRVPEAEPFRLTDAEWNFFSGYFQPSEKPKTPPERKRFQRLREKFNDYLLHYAVYFRPAEVA
jgi:hypothetical protein